MDDAQSVFVALVVVTMVWLLVRAVIRFSEVRLGAAEELRAMRRGESTPMRSSVG